MQIRFLAILLTAALTGGISGTLVAQDSESLVEYQRNLSQVRREIDEMRERIEEIEQAERSATQSLAGLEKKIFYQRRLVKALNGTQSTLQKKVKTTERQIQDQEAELERRRDLLVKRARHLYVHGRSRELEALLSSESFSQTQIRLRYLQYFIRSDRDQIETLKTLIKDLRQNKARLEGDLAAKERARRDSQQEVQKLDRTQRDRKRRQVALRKDRQAVEQALQEKQASLAQIQRLNIILPRMV